MHVASVVLNGIAELQTNGLATREWITTGRLLALCQRCERFTGDGCREEADFLELLTTRERWCERWVGLDGQ
jgi:hypothetical protein